MRIMQPLHSGGTKRRRGPSSPLWRPGKADLEFRDVYQRLRVAALGVAGCIRGWHTTNHTVTSRPEGRITSNAPERLKNAPKIQLRPVGPSGAGPGGNRFHNGELGAEPIDLGRRLGAVSSGSSFRRRA